MKIGLEQFIEENPSVMQTVFLIISMMAFVAGAAFAIFFFTFIF